MFRLFLLSVVAGVATCQSKQSNQILRIVPLNLVQAINSQRTTGTNVNTAIKPALATTSTSRSGNSLSSRKQNTAVSAQAIQEAERTLQGLLDKVNLALGETFRQSIVSQIASLRNQRNNNQIAQLSNKFGRENFVQDVKGQPTRTANNQILYLYGSPITSNANSRSVSSSTSSLSNTGYVNAAGTPLNTDGSKTSSLIGGNKVRLTDGDQLLYDRPVIGGAKSQHYLHISGVTNKNTQTNTKPQSSPISASASNALYSGDVQKIAEIRGPSQRDKDRLSGGVFSSTIIQGNSIADAMNALKTGKTTNARKTSEHFSVVNSVNGGSGLNQPLVSNTVMKDGIMRTNVADMQVVGEISSSSLPSPGLYTVEKQTNNPSTQQSGHLLAVSSPGQTITYSKGHIDRAVSVNSLSSPFPEKKGQQTVLSDVNVVSSNLSPRDQVNSDVINAIHRDAASNGRSLLSRVAENKLQHNGAVTDVYSAADTPRVHAANSEVSTGLSSVIQKLSGNKLTSALPLSANALSAATGSGNNVASDRIDSFIKSLSSTSGTFPDSKQTISIVADQQGSGQPFADQYTLRGQPRSESVNHLSINNDIVTTKVEKQSNSNIATDSSWSAIERMTPITGANNNEKNFFVNGKGMNYNSEGLALTSGVGDYNILAMDGRTGLSTKQGGQPESTYRIPTARLEKNNNVPDSGGSSYSQSQTVSSNALHSGKPAQSNSNIDNNNIIDSLTSDTGIIADSINPVSGYLTDKPSLVSAVEYKGKRGESEHLLPTLASRSLESLLSASEYRGTLGESKLPLSSYVVQTDKGSVKNRNTVANSGIGSLDKGQTLVTGATTDHDGGIYKILGSMIGMPSSMKEYVGISQVNSKVDKPTNYPITDPVFAKGNTVISGLKQINSISEHTTSGAGAPDPADSSGTNSITSVAGKTTKNRYIGNTPGGKTTYESPNGKSITGIVTDFSMANAVNEYVDNQKLSGQSMNTKTTAGNVYSINQQLGGQSVNQKFTPGNEYSINQQLGGQLVNKKITGNEYSNNQQLGGQSVIQKQTAGHEYSINQQLGDQSANQKQTAGNEYSINQQLGGQSLNQILTGNEYSINQQLGGQSMNQKFTVNEYSNNQQLGDQPVDKQYTSSNEYSVRQEMSGQPANQQSTGGEAFTGSMGAVTKNTPLVNSLSGTSSTFENKASTGYTGSNTIRTSANSLANTGVTDRRILLADVRNLLRNGILSGVGHDINGGSLTVNSIKDITPTMFTNTLSSVTENSHQNNAWTSVGKDEAVSIHDPSVKDSLSPYRDINHISIKSQTSSLNRNVGLPAQTIKMADGFKIASTKNQVVSYTEPGQIGSTQGTSYTGTSQIENLQRASYTGTSQTGNTQEASYTGTSQTGNTEGTSYTGTSQTGNTQGASYTGTSQTGNTEGASYTGTSKTGNTQGASYTDTSHTGRTQGASYTGTSQTGNTQGATYTSKSQTGNTQGTSYTGTGQTGNTQGASYTGTSQTGNPQGLTYTGTGQTGDTLGASYTGLSQTGNAQGTSYTGTGQTGNTQGSSYTGTSQTGDTLGTSYTGTSQTGNTQGTSYTGTGQTGNTQGASYTGISKTGNTQGASYTGTSQTGNAFESSGSANDYSPGAISSSISSFKSKSLRTLPSGNVLAGISKIGPIYQKTETTVIKNGQASTGYEIPTLPDNQLTFTFRDMYTGSSNDMRVPNTNHRGQERESTGPNVSGGQSRIHFIDAKPNNKQNSGPGFNLIDGMTKANSIVTGNGKSSTGIGLETQNRINMLHYSVDKLKQGQTADQAVKRNGGMPDAYVNKKTTAYDVINAKASNNIIVGSKSTKEQEMINSNTFKPKTGTNYVQGIGETVKSTSGSEGQTPRANLTPRVIVTGITKNVEVTGSNANSMPNSALTQLEKTLMYEQPGSREEKQFMSALLAALQTQGSNQPGSTSPLNIGNVNTERTNAGYGILKSELSLLEKMSGNDNNNNENSYKDQRKAFADSENKPESNEKESGPIDSEENQRTTLMSRYKNAQTGDDKSDIHTSGKDVSRSRGDDKTQSDIYASGKGTSRSHGDDKAHADIHTSGKKTSRSRGDDKAHADIHTSGKDTSRSRGDDKAQTDIHTNEKDTSRLRGDDKAQFDIHTSRKDSSRSHGDDKRLDLFNTDDVKNSYDNSVSSHRVLPRKVDIIPPGQSVNTARAATSAQLTNTRLQPDPFASRLSSKRNSGHFKPNIITGDSTYGINPSQIGSQKLITQPAKDYDLRTTTGSDVMLRPKQFLSTSIPAADTVDWNKILRLIGYQDGTRTNNAFEMGNIANDVTSLPMIPQSSYPQDSSSNDVLNFQNRFTQPIYRQSPPLNSNDQKYMSDLTNLQNQLSEALGIALPTGVAQGIPNRQSDSVLLLRPLDTASLQRLENSGANHEGILNGYNQAQTGIFPNTGSDIFQQLTYNFPTDTPTLLSSFRSGRRYV